MTEYSYLERKAKRRAYALMAYDHGATHTITFIFNHKHGTTNLDSANALIRKWHMMLDRVICGKRYNKLPQAQRTSFIAFPEHINSNLHYHAVLTTPNIAKFSIVAEMLWKDIVRSGNLHFHDEAITPVGLAKWCIYITKDVMKGDNEENIIYSGI